MSPRPIPGARFDDQGRFLGFEANPDCEHRTVGSHRAWCYDCGEWCYPDNPCSRCERSLGISGEDDEDEG